MKLGENTAHTLKLAAAPPLRLTAPELVDAALADHAPLLLELERDAEAPLRGLTDRPRLTRGLRHTLARLRYAVDSHAPLMLIVGTHGGGKSTAARLYAEGRPEVIYVEVPPEYRAKHLVADLTQRLRIDVGESYRLRTVTLIDYLRSNPRTIVLDEAQRLDYRTMDMLKYLADSAAITVVLCGSASLERQVERHTDISSRVWVRVHVTPIPLEEFRVVYAGDGYTPDTLTAIHSASEGVMRRIAALTLHLDVALAGREGMTRADLTPDHVLAATEVVF